MQVGLRWLVSNYLVFSSRFQFVGIVQFPLWGSFLFYLGVVLLWLLKDLSPHEAIQLLLDSLLEPSDLLQRPFRPRIDSVAASYYLDLAPSPIAMCLWALPT